MLDGLATFIWVHAGEDRKNFVNKAAVASPAVAWEPPILGFDPLLPTPLTPKLAPTPPTFAASPTMVATSSAVQAPAVPEPTAGMLAVVGAGYLSSRRRR